MNIRVCPERDGKCPYGSTCPYVKDRYRCKPGWDTPPVQARVKITDAMVDAAMKTAFDEAEKAGHAPPPDMGSNDKGYLEFRRVVRLMLRAAADTL